MTRQYRANRRWVARSTACTRVSVVTRVHPSGSGTTRKFITTRAKPGRAESAEERRIQRRHIPALRRARDVRWRDGDRAKEQLAILLLAQQYESTG
jgi:hypothetical protein